MTQLYSDYNKKFISYKNKLINGSFNFWQRNTSQTSDGYGSDDRWDNESINGISKTHSRQTFTVGQTDVPGNPKYYSRTVISGGGTAGTRCIKKQHIESVLTLSGEAATISFWAKCSTTANIGITFEQWFGTGGSPSSPVTDISATLIPISTSWKKYSLTVDLPSISGKTLGSNGDDHLTLDLWFEAGSNYNSVFPIGNQTGTFDISQVQLESGRVSSNFEQLPYDLELKLCQRYYEKSFNLDTIPDDDVEDGRNLQPWVAADLETLYLQQKFKVRKRSTPTLTFYQGDSAITDAASGEFSFYFSGSWTSVTLLTVVYNSETSFRVSGTFTPVLNSGHAYLSAGHWTADSEI